MIPCPVCNKRPGTAPHSENLRLRLCMACRDASGGEPDGPGTTEDMAKVLPLFQHRPTAAGLPPQPDVVAALEDALQDAVSGKLTGLLMIGFNPQGDTLPVTAGKIIYASMITELESMKIRAILTQEPYLFGKPK